MLATLQLVAMHTEAAGTSSASTAIDRRQHDRFAGPFDGIRVGALEMPVRIYDLSRGGCFINSVHEQEPGVKFILKIDLPREGWIEVRAETLYLRPHFGFAVRFTEISDEAEQRLERALEALRNGTATGASSYLL